MAKMFFQESLRLLINLFGNRVYEQQHLKSIMERCFRLTKFHREAKSEVKHLRENIQNFRFYKFFLKRLRLSRNYANT